MTECYRPRDPVAIFSRRLNEGARFGAAYQSRDHEGAEVELPFWHVLARCHLPWRALTLVAALVMLCPGCVRRTLTIRTVPDGGLVFLNDEEVGYSPVSVDFTWYGDYDVVVRKPGYQTLKTHMLVRQPWYQIPPIDFFAEVVWAGHLHDQHEGEFELQPESLPEIDDLINRAKAMRRESSSADG